MTPCSISQKKKSLPASPDHSVPSQSNTARRGRKTNTLPRNSSACFVREKDSAGLLRELGIILGSIDVQRDIGIIDRHVFNTALVCVFHIARRGIEGRA